MDEKAARGIMALAGRMAKGGALPDVLPYGTRRGFFARLKNGGTDREKPGPGIFFSPLICPANRYNLPVLSFLFF